jgi:hypothetical protein
MSSPNATLPVAFDEPDDQVTDLIACRVDLGHQRAVVSVWHLDDEDIMIACRGHGCAKRLILPCLEPMTPVANAGTESGRTAIAT